MNRALRLTLRALGIVVAVVVVLAGAALAYLTIPGTPDASKVLAFQRYIVLPRDRTLNVADYLTLSGGYLYVTQPSSGSVFKVHLGDGEKADSVSTLSGEPRAHGIALVPGQDLAFVSRSEVNTVDVFAPSSMQRMATLPVADDADAILFDPVARLVYVANGDAGVATLIDPARRAVVGTIALGGKPEFAVFDPVTKLVYQNLNDANALVVVDPLERRVVRRWTVAACEGPTGLALDGIGGLAFMGCGKNSKLVVFDLKHQKVVAVLDIGRGRIPVAFDPSLRRIYTTGVAGVVSIVQMDDAGHFKKLDDVSTHIGAHTLAVDPVSHRVYVAYASLFVVPRVAVFAAGP